ncbi:MAG: hypothetical protein WC821_01335 [archaeon]|jgi:hypothetical protein
MVTPFPKLKLLKKATRPYVKKPLEGEAKRKAVLKAFMQKTLDKKRKEIK